MSDEELEALYVQLEEAVAKGDLEQWMALAKVIDKEEKRREAPK
jgi:hypothetical protein